MFKKTGDNSFEFVNKPTIVMLRSTEEFWRQAEPGEVLRILDTAGMPIEYSDGKNSWYPAVDTESFVKPAPVEKASK